MKKLLTLVSAITFLTFGLNSCSKSSDDLNGTHQPQAVVVHGTQAQLLGVVDGSTISSNTSITWLRDSLVQNNVVITDVVYLRFTADSLVTLLADGSIAHSAEFYSISNDSMYRNGSYWATISITTTKMIATNTSSIQYFTKQ